MGLDSMHGQHHSTHFIFLLSCLLYIQSLSYHSPNASYVSPNTLFSFFINYLLGCVLDYWPIIDSFAHVH